MSNIVAIYACQIMTYKTLRSKTQTFAAKTGAMQHNLKGIRERNTRGKVGMAVLYKLLNIES